MFLNVRLHGRLLKSLLTNEIPESKEISEMVRQEVKVAEIEEYGPEKLPCGPGIEKADAIVIVEGRADVINLLKNDVTNVVAVGGANVTNAIAKLAREKEVTVFLDGDRGGDIILTELARVADIDFVARAPTGKEVEELTRKELIKCLRSKVPFEQGGQKEGGEERRDYGRERGRRFERDDRRRDGRDERRPERDRGMREEQQPQQPSQLPEPQAAVQAEPVPQPQREEHAPSKPADVPPQLLASLDELENTLRARFYNAELSATKEMPVRDMIKSLEEEQGVYAIVFDGIITQRLADMAENKKVGILAAMKLGNVFRKPASVLIHTKT